MIGQFFLAVLGILNAQVVSDKVTLINFRQGDNLARITAISALNRSKFSWKIHYPGIQVDCPRNKVIQLLKDCSAPSVFTVETEDSLAQMGLAGKVLPALPQINFRTDGSGYRIRVEANAVRNKSRIPFDISTIVQSAKVKLSKAQSVTIDYQPKAVRTNKGQFVVANLIWICIDGHKYVCQVLGGKVISFYVDYS